MVMSSSPQTVAMAGIVAGEQAGREEHFPNAQGRARAFRARLVGISWQVLQSAGVQLSGRTLLRRMAARVAAATTLTAGELQGMSW